MPVSTTLAASDRSYMVTSHNESTEVHHWYVSYHHVNPCSLAYRFDAAQMTVGVKGTNQHKTSDRRPRKTRGAGTWFAVVRGVQCGIYDRWYYSFSLFFWLCTNLLPAGCLVTTFLVQRTPSTRLAWLSTRGINLGKTRYSISHKLMHVVWYTTFREISWVSFLAFSYEAFSNSCAAGQPHIHQLPLVVDQFPAHLMSHLRPTNISVSTASAIVVFRGLCTGVFRDWFVLQPIT